jgi:hypothetical protein
VDTVFRRRAFNAKRREPHRRRRRDRRRRTGFELRAGNAPASTPLAALSSMREDEDDQKQDEARGQEKPRERDGRRFDKRTEGDTDNPLICRGVD